jgi:hypothetical protein
VAEILIRLIGADVRPTHTDRRDVDNIRRRVVNIEKTRRTLRWVPEVTLEEGLRRTVEWQRGVAGERGAAAARAGRAQAGDGSASRRSGIRPARMRRASAK